MAGESLSRTQRNNSEDRPLLIKHLTPRQEERLRTFLDERLSGLERDERTHKLGPVPQLSSRLSTLLQIILQIPPSPPFASLRVSYLLTLTSVIPLYITALPLLSTGHRTQQEAQEEAASVIEGVLGLLKEVENGWLAVLRSDGWIPPRTQLDEKGDSEGARSHLIFGGKSVEVEFGGQVDITEKIRLKSIVMSSRSRLLAWSRPYGNFDCPGSSLPDEETEPQSDTNTVVATHSGGWEEEVLLMWNNLLEVLSNDLA
ncbi:hypothetical protein I302_102001 [Kwoniella bestiolae CBS 10118]|uniref:Uncharacterized protein n=1 Tax=Kwoniella bestiolae CBS 10118 TaxID=1296100 RepID=A0A1B9GDU9_9TREE|nr:hypothetical protein I302_00685 [Kwoniella bestiolae CBS 10118]OCF29189.1 hypothetical protein I302_00685 [Kwoniella bestiolae CBS 10118]